MKSPNFYLTFGRFHSLISDKKFGKFSKKPLTMLLGPCILAKWQNFATNKNTGRETISMLPPGPVIIADQLEALSF
jgi:hypothetical protein